ncbi:MAG: hypothetical protein H6609_17230 [Ignavibacteriales bacterium]|nr:hypothetical protein [Ignavibacteriales bacterium]
MKVGGLVVRTELVLAAANFRNHAPPPFLLRWSYNLESFTTQKSPRLTGSSWFTNILLILTSSATFSLVK